MTNQNVKKSCRFYSQVLHLFTQTIATDITQPYTLAVNSGAFSPVDTFSSSQHSSKSTSRWLVFVSINPTLNKKCVLCYDAIMLKSKMCALKWLGRKYRGNVKNGIFFCEIRHLRKRVLWQTVGY